MVSPRARYWVLYCSIVYINDLAKTITDVAKPILFADDTSIIIDDSNPDEFSMKLDLVVNQTVQWFQCNLLSELC